VFLLSGFCNFSQGTRLTGENRKGHFLDEDEPTRCTQPGAFVLLKELVAEQRAQHLELIHHHFLGLNAEGAIELKAREACVLLGTKAVDEAVVHHAHCVQRCWNIEVCIRRVEAVPHVAVPPNNELFPGFLFVLNKPFMQNLKHLVVRVRASPFGVERKGNNPRTFSEREQRHDQP
jgi:hypothetical protein